MIVNVSVNVLWTLISINHLIVVFYVHLTAYIVWIISHVSNAKDNITSHKKIHVLYSAL